MPKELRKLVFDDTELKSAVYDYCLRNNVQIPKSGMEKIVANDEDERFLVIQFYSEDENSPKEVALSRDQAGAALIKFCSANDVPLPRTGQKLLKVDGGEVSMMISIQRPTKKS